MALKSTVFKATLSISDLDRGYYAEHALTLARHPSETDERMMIRLLAFALFADPQLEFGKGLSAADEPDLWQRDYTGRITHWIEAGLPDERTVKRALSRADKVSVIAYGGRTMEIWWEKEGPALSRLPRLAVLSIDTDSCAMLTALAERSMQIQCTVQDGALWLNAGDQMLTITPEWRLKPAA
jgi:uncharacterized protein YaeQ